MIKNRLILCGVLIFSAVQLRAESYAYPVPFVKQQHTTINFKDLPSEGSIKIFTVNGESVKEISFDTNRPDPLPWDVTNGSGKQVATGVYLFEVTGPGHKSEGKLVVIR